MRVIFLLLLLIFAIWPSSATMTGDDRLSCKLEPHKGFIWRFLDRSHVNFRRNGKVVAEGANKNNRLGYVNHPWSNIPERWNNPQRVDFEVVKDQDGKLNYVFFSFLEAQANGTIVLRTMQNRTATNLYVTNAVDGTRSLSLVYFESITADAVFNDLSCLMESGGLAK